MHILGSFVVFCAALSISTAFVNLDQLNHDIRRLKRQTTSATADDGSLCLLTCIETMERQLESVKSARAQRTRFQQQQEQHSTGSTCQRYEPEQLENLCGAHRRAKECLDACPVGEMREVGYRALAPLNFMCADRLDDFKQHLPCLDSICDSVEGMCQPSCTQYKTSVDKLTDMQRDQSVRQSYDAQTVLKIVSDACGYIDCFNDCSRPLIMDKCGAAAADLQRDTVRKAFSSITNILSNAGESEDELPHACQSLMTPTEEFPQEPTVNTTSTVDFGVSTKATKPIKTTIATSPAANGGRSLTTVPSGPSGAEILDQDQVRLLLEEANMLTSGGERMYVMSFGVLVVIVSILRSLM